MEMGDLDKSLAPFLVRGKYIYEVLPFPEYYNDPTLNRMYYKRFNIHTDLEVISVDGSCATVRYRDKTLVETVFKIPEILFREERISLLERSEYYLDILYEYPEYVASCPLADRNGDGREYFKVIKGDYVPPYYARLSMEQIRMYTKRYTTLISELL